MLYALYVGFISVFAAMAALGHALLLVAVYPNLFGTPQHGFGEIEPASHEPISPQNPRIA
jgi:hypothetical protein